MILHIKPILRGVLGQGKITVSCSVHHGIYCGKSSFKYNMLKFTIIVTFLSNMLYGFGSFRFMT